MYKCLDVAKHVWPPHTQGKRCKRFVSPEMTLQPTMYFFKQKLAKTLASGQHKLHGTLFHSTIQQVNPMQPAYDKVCVTRQGTIP